MCAEPIPSEHGHVADLDTRGIMCTCRGCFLLFTNTGAGGNRFRAIPDRYRYDPDFALSQAAWDAIGIPVRMAFFFTNSVLGSTVAFYPSPAGATECLLSLEQWQRVITDNPDFADVAPDVEALLVTRSDTGFECFLLPIDACYRLVGLVKMHWKGFDGGTEAWAAIDAFFDELRQRGHG